MSFPVLKIHMKIINKELIVYLDLMWSPVFKTCVKNKLVLTFMRQLEAWTLRKYLIILRDF